MLNQVILVGKVVEFEQDTFSIVIDIQSKHNREKFDRVRVFCKKALFDNTNGFCGVGSVIGIKAELKSNDTSKATHYISAEKVTFISV